MHIINFNSDVFISSVVYFEFWDTSGQSMSKFKYNMISKIIISFIKLVIKQFQIGQLKSADKRFQNCLYLYIFWSLWDQVCNLKSVPLLTC